MNDEERKARLALALRQNLRRRKGQAREQTRSPKTSCPRSTLAVPNLWLIDALDAVNGGLTATNRILRMRCEKSTKRRRTASDLAIKPLCWNSNRPGWSCRRPCLPLVTKGSIPSG